MTAERRAQAEHWRATWTRRAECAQTEREFYDASAEASMLADLLAEIDRLTAERDAAVVAAVMAEREACAAICDAHPAAMLASRERKRQGRRLPPEAWEAITTEEKGEKIAAEIIARAIRSRPAPAPAVESSTP